MTGKLTRELQQLDSRLSAGYEGSLQDGQEHNQFDEGENPIKYAVYLPAPE